MGWFGQASEHDADHSEANERRGRSCIAFEVAREASVAADPCEGSLDDPPFGQDDEAMQFVALDDLQGPGAGLGDGGSGFGSLVAGVGEDALDERKQTARAPIEDERGAIAILHVGRVNDDVQQEAQRVDENMPFAACNLLARIEALRIERGAPFCAALALWLSMIAAVGLASRPSRSRVAT
jgi:hypothetical protein